MIIPNISFPAVESQDVDAIAIIIADHRNVTNLFAEFDNLKARGSKAKAAMWGESVRL
jgi:hypothetical protein